MAVRKLHVGLLLVVVVALGAASLGAAFKLQEHAGRAEDADDGIGVVIFEPSLADKPDARDGRLVLVTRRQGSYGEADTAIALAIQRHCPDGRGHSSSDHEPDLVISAEDWDKPTYPAGSRFSQTIGCNGPLPNEFPIAAGTPEKAAEAAVQRVLAELGAGASDQSFVMTVPYYQQQPKYRAFDHALGAVLRGFASDHCRDGRVVVDAIVVGTYPPPTAAKENQSIRHSRIMLGTAMSCLVSESGDA